MRISIPIISWVLILLTLVAPLCFGPLQLTQSQKLDKTDNVVSQINTNHAEHLLLAVNNCPRTLAAAAEKGG
jgi:hypothetical protein